MQWYEEDVMEAEKRKEDLPYYPATLFYGSSSIRLWNTLHNDFQPYCPLNMGFGGSTLEACAFFFERLMKDLQPTYLMLYAGDNDLGDGKKPEMVFQYYLQLDQLIRSRYPAIPYTYVSIKPSLTRWNIDHSIRKTNDLIQHEIGMKDNTFFLDIYTAMLGTDGLPVKALYGDDGLHLSAAGYALWKELFLNHISSQINTPAGHC